MIALQCAALPMFETINCVAPDGTVNAFVGPSGSGKSVVLSLLIGRYKPSSGRLRVGQVDPAADPIAVRRHVCFVALGAPLLPDLSVVDNVKLALALTGSPPATYQQIAYALRVSEVPDRQFHQPARRLTKCEGLCTWLAIHHLRRTSVLVIDEPAGDLPAAAQRDASRLIREAVTGAQVGVFTSRDLGFAYATADQVFRIEQGVIELDSARSRPATGVAPRPFN